MPQTVFQKYKVTPHDIGRTPRKIECNFAGFTADQWKNWTVIYSSYARQGILPQKDLDCWLLFVNACKIMGIKVITTEDIALGDSYMMQVVQLYGSEVVTPNMHLHGHLKECVNEFGPFHGFWCFSFERYNASLGHAIQTTGQ